ncbi:hypothetical protein BDR05DRAFT_996036 [Suillus weaverae]|nr:hypothetical protein BDR05DRAFT_996036 [Suillus weaverae]
MSTRYLHMLTMYSAFSASYNSPQMSDSGSIVPCSQSGNNPEVIPTMISEDVEEILHPDVVAAMKAVWAQACEEDEYLKEVSLALQAAQNNQTPFPTLNHFTAPVAGLPQFPPMDPSQYYSPQPSAVPQGSLEGHAWSHQCFGFRRRTPLASRSRAHKLD